MAVTWLHVSDFTSGAAIPMTGTWCLRRWWSRSPTYRRQGRRPDLIFATGDVAHGGSRPSMRRRRRFSTPCWQRPGWRRRLFVSSPAIMTWIVTRATAWPGPSNSREERTGISPGKRKPHLRDKLGAFAKWYRSLLPPRPGSSRPTPPAGRRKSWRWTGGGLAFCRSTARCSARTIMTTASCWLAAVVWTAGWRSFETEAGSDDWAEFIIRSIGCMTFERSNISAKLRDNADIVLRGHLHEIDAEHVAGVLGTCLHIAAGAAYQSPEMAEPRHLRDVGWRPA